MSSLLAISNKALAKLGVKEINSLTQQGKPAARCNAHVVEAVKETLREHTWSHASEWKALPQLLGVPPFGYEYAYQAPQETVKVFDVRQDTDLKAIKIKFEMVRGKIIYTDADPCYARYVVYFEADLTQAPPDFLDTCAFKLAAEIAIPLSKVNLQVPMLNGYTFSLAKAMKNDAQETNVEKVDENRECKFLAERGFPPSADAETY
ncbi:MAG: hypothetical protein KAJ19_03950 [Gammaproteobacteria bacterium]|nr:hypothetical protein [Gammaproteobacteria bacterium]